MKVGDIAGEPAFILVLLEGREPRREEEAWCEKRLCLSQHISDFLMKFWASQVTLVGKNLPANAGDRHSFDPWVRKDPLEEGMATHSSILPWRIPLTEEPGRLQYMGSQSRTWLKRLIIHCQEKVIQTLLHVWLWDDSMQPTPSVYPGHFPPYMDWFLILHVYILFQSIFLLLENYGCYRNQIF